MIPPIFKDSRTWFKLWKAAEYQEQENPTKAVYLMKTDIDGELHTIQFVDINASKNLCLLVKITGPLVGGFMHQSPKNSIGFNISFKVTPSTKYGEDAVCRLRGKHTPIKVLTKKYLNRCLPSFYEKEDRDMIEHVVMMFILSTDGVLS